MSTVNGPADKYLPPTVNELVERVKTVLTDPALQWKPGYDGQTNLAVAASLAHVCHLLELIDREYQAGRAISMEMSARAHLEASLAAIYLTAAPEEALAYLTGASARILRLMQEELARHDKAVKDGRKKAERLNRVNDANNAGITAKNKRDGTQIPMRAALPTDGGVLMGFDAKPLLESIASDEHEFDDSSANFVVTRIKAITAESVAPLDLANFYSLGYRGLSMNSVHPTATVLARYAQVGEVWTVKLMSDPPSDDGLRHFAVFLSALVAERVVEYFGLDGSWFGSHLARMAAQADALTDKENRGV